MYAEQAGYSAVLIMNNGVGAAPRCDAVNLNMTTDNSPAPVSIKMLLIPRTIGFRMLGLYDPATYACNPANPGANTPNPPVGTAGLPVRLAFDFDGWGYTHVYENGTGKLRRIDSYAIPEGLDERFATGFGDLTVHEFATDPTEYLAYSSYYAAGMRVFRFGADGLTEVGKYIPERGANFWGVEQFTQNNVRYFAGSDRDYGLYIFRYTGSGAAQPPKCSNSISMVPFKSSGPVTLPCSDANGNPLRRAVVAPPTAGALSGDVASGSATYTHTGDRLGSDRFTFKASDGSLESDPATAQIVIVPRKGGRCFNLLAGTASNEMLTGSQFGDRIRGGGGRDRIKGRAGGDCLAGEAGHDRLFGDDGRDRLRGGGGKDRLRGGPGSDSLFGGVGADRLQAGSGKRNLLSGGGGNDRLLAINGRRDTVQCGGGRDRVQADSNDRVAGNCEAVSRD